MADQNVVLLADFVVNHGKDGDLGQKIDLHLFGCPGFVDRIAHDLPVELTVALLLPGENIQPLFLRSGPDSGFALDEKGGQFGRGVAERRTHADIAADVVHPQNQSIQREIGGIGLHGEVLEPGQSGLEF